MNLRSTNLLLYLTQERWKFRRASQKGSLNKLRDNVKLLRMRRNQPMLSYSLCLQIAHFVKHIRKMKSWKYWTHQGVKYIRERWNHENIGHAKEFANEVWKFCTILAGSVVSVTGQVWWEINLIGREYYIITFEP